MTTSSEPVPCTGPPSCRVRSSVYSAVLKGEDFHCIARDQPLPPSEHTFGYREGSYPEKYDLFVVCDGHNGTEAATFFTEHIVEALAARVPAGVPPPLGTRDASQWMAAFRGAVADVVLHLEEQFARVALSSGCTVSVAIIVGRWLMVANVGDSSIVLDTGETIEQLNIDHRIEDNVREQERIIQAGGLLSRLDVTGMGPCFDEEGFGPLRVWPGGLALSRAFGDFDVGEFIMSSPYIQQTMLPEAGARLVLASDGVWDSFKSIKDACTGLRRHPVEKAAMKSVMNAIRRRGLMDDTTALVVDILPTDATYTFPELCGYAPLRWMCFKRREAPDEGSNAGSTRGAPVTLRSVDTGIRPVEGEPGSMHSSGHKRSEVLRALYAHAVNLRDPATTAPPKAGPRGDVSVYAGGAYKQAVSQGDAKKLVKYEIKGSIDVSVHAGTKLNEDGTDDRTQRLREVQEALKRVKTKGERLRKQLGMHRTSMEVQIPPPQQIVQSNHGRFNHNLFNGAVPMVATPGGGENGAPQAVPAPASIVARILGTA